MSIDDRADEIFEIGMENQCIYGNSFLLIDKARDYIIHNIGNSEDCFVKNKWMYNE